MKELAKTALIVIVVIAVLRAASSFTAKIPVVGNLLAF